MITRIFKDFNEYKQFLRTRTAAYPMLAYVVLKKIYKQRSYTINMEVLSNDSVNISSFLNTNIDESDFKKMKYILSKTKTKDVTDLAKKAIAFQYEIKSEKEITDLYEIVQNGLLEIQFSDFYNA